MTTETLKNVIDFSVNAEAEVEQDFITITFQAVESGADATLVQTKLAEKLSAALNIARAKKVAGEVDVKSGNLRIGPTYNKKGEINGYNGYVQMTVYGTDTKTVSGLTGEIASMTVADVQHGVSPDLRKSTETSLALKAIELWMAKGHSYSSAFGKGGYVILNANVQVNNNGYYPRRAGAVRAMAASMDAAGSSYDDEAGKETLTATVSGSIQLLG